MYEQHVTFEKQCLVCKLGAGALFVGFGGFHVARAHSMWRYFKASDKAFNVGAISFIFLLGGLNFYKAYEIYLGKQMDLVELRPSYTQRFRNSYSFMMMTPEEKTKYLEQ